MKTDVVKRLVERQIVKISNTSFQEWVKEEEKERGGFYDSQKDKKVRYYEQLSEKGKKEVKNQYDKIRKKVNIGKYETLALKGNLIALKISIIMTKNFQKFKKPLAEIGKSKKIQFEVGDYEVDRGYQVDPTPTKYLLDFSNLSDREKKILERNKIPDLKASKASGITLKKISFQDIDLSWSNFSKSKIGYCNFKGATLTGSRFIKSTLSSVNFNDANLSLVDFQGVNLSSMSILPGLSKPSDIFVGANLSKANFAGANLINVDFSGIKDLKKEDFFFVDSKTKVSETTIPPKEVKKALARTEAILLEIETGKKENLSKCLNLLKEYREVDLYMFFDLDKKIEEGISKIENMSSWKKYLTDFQIPISFSLKELGRFFKSTNTNVTAFIDEINKSLKLSGVNTRDTYLTEPINTNERSNRLKGEVVYTGEFKLPSGDTQEYFLTVDISDSGFLMGNKFYQADSYFFCLPKKRCSSRMKDLGKRKAQEIAFRLLTEHSLS